MSILLYLLVFKFITISAVLEREKWPGYEYIPALNGWMKLHHTPADWQAARIACHDEDALLASPWSTDFTAAINEMQRTRDQTLSVLHSGVRMNFAEGMYRYFENGTYLLSLDPNFLQSVEYCFAFFANGTLGAVDCEERNPFVCYAVVELPKDSDCGNASLGYEFVNTTGHCYKFHTRVELWDDAYRICKEEGAHLAVIDNSAEARVLVDIFKRHSETEIDCHNVSVCEKTTFVAIGFYYWKVAGGHWTVHGQNLEHSGYANWHDGAPIGGPRVDGYRGGGMDRNGKLVDLRKSASFPFICEKDPTL